MSNASAQELWDAQNLQKAYIAHRQSRGAFKQLQAPWNNIDEWVKVVRKAFHRGIGGGDNIMAALIAAADGRTVMAFDIHRLMGTDAFKIVAQTRDLLPMEAEEMRELGMDPGNPDHVNQFHIRDWLKSAMRSIAAVAGTTDVNSNLFIHNLVYDITGTAPFLRYLLGWKRQEVELEVGESARAFFKEKRHLAKACVALGWPKEIIAPDFEL